MKIKYNKELYPELEIIKNETEKITGIEDISCTARARQNVFARWLYIKAARELTRYSLLNIASAIGRDHATIVHAIRNMDFDFKYDPELQTQYDELAIILTNKLQSDSIEQLDKRIHKLEVTLRKLTERRSKLINYESTNTEFQNQKNEQIFWS